MDPARKNRIWARSEPYIATYGQWVWWILLLAAIFYVIIAIVISPNIILVDFGIRFWWDLIFAGLSIVLSFKWVKPRFSTLCASREWQSLADDVFVIKNVRIPKMLLVNLLLVVFSIMEYGWGSLVVLVPTLFIFAFAPIKVAFRATAPRERKVVEQPAPKPVEKKLVVPKVADKLIEKVVVKKSVETKAAEPLAGKPVVTKSVEMKVAEQPAAKPVETPAPVSAVEKKEEITDVPTVPKPAKKATSKPAKKSTKKASKKAAKNTAPA